MRPRFVGTVISMVTVLALGLTGVASAEDIEGDAQSGGVGVAEEPLEDQPSAGALVIPDSGGPTERAAVGGSTLGTSAVADRAEFLMKVEPGHSLGRNGRYLEYMYTDATPWNWASTMCSSMSVEGERIRIVSACTKDRLRTTLLDPTSKEVVSQKEVVLSGVLPIVGGIEIMPDGYIYLVTGQDNPAKDDSREVVRVSKFDLSLGFVGSTSMTSGLIYGGSPHYLAGITKPFNAGSLRMAMADSVLYIHSAREMYSGHQSNFTVSLDASIMGDMQDLTTRFYTSHSFNQYVGIYGDSLVAVDHGDAYPREILLQQLHRSFQAITARYAMQSIVGNIGDNYTYTTASGMALAGSSASVVGISSPQENPVQDVVGVVANKSKQYTSNLFVSTVDLDTGAQNFAWITNNNPKTSSTILGQPTVTALPGGNLVILYHTVAATTYQRTLEYRLVTTQGEVLASSSYPDTAYLPSSPPVLVGSTLYWSSVPQLNKPITSVDTNGTEQYLFGLDLADPTAPEMLQKLPLEAPEITVTGVGEVGRELTAVGATLAGFTPSATSMHYQWLRNGAAISGATGQTYKLVNADASTNVSVRVTGVRENWLTTDTTSAEVRVLGLFKLPVVSVSGSTVQGGTLSVAGGGAGNFTPSATGVAYQWLRDGEEIAWATGSTYTTSAADRWKDISVRVTGTRDGYQAGVATSEAVMISQRTDVHRLAGSNRYGTNLAVNTVAARVGKPLFIATGSTFPDALSIGPAVALTEGSLFLTPPAGFNAATIAQIKALSPTRVYIVGGEGAVSSQVAAQVRSATGVMPERVGGINRYETSAKVLSRFFSGRTVPTAFVATGRDYPDALSASAAGGVLAAPVVLVDGTAATALNSSVLNQLKQVQTREVMVAGGVGAVNQAIYANLAKDFSVSRLEGINRYATNMAVNDMLDQRVSVSMETVWIATGANFPDALSAAAPAGTGDARLVLSRGQCIPKPVVSGWIKAPGSLVGTVNLVGGTGVLAPSVEALRECS